MNSSYAFVSFLFYLPHCIRGVFLFLAHFVSVRLVVFLVYSVSVGPIVFGVLEILLFIFQLFLDMMRVL